MNRKIILTLLSLWAFGAYAQEKQLNFSNFEQREMTMPRKDMKVDKSRSLNKTEASGTRTMNIIDALYSSTSPSIINNIAVAPLFDDSTALIAYSDGTVGNTYFYGSYQVFQPQAAVNNYDFVYAGQVDLSQNQSGSYMLDSIAIYGIYGRNDMSSTDSLIFNITNSDDLTSYYFTGMTANFGVDTLRFAGLDFDSATNEAVTTTGIRIAIPLTDASVVDTTATGWNKFKFPVGLSYSANDLITVAVSFKYGGTFTPFVDTLNRTLNYFSPRYFEETAGGYPTYTPGEWNVTGVAFNSTKYNTSSSWKGSYIPSFAYTAPFRLEYLDLDYVITCTDCAVLSIEDNKKIATGKAYPNPSNRGYLTIPVSAKENTNIRISISNLLGQVISTEDYGTISGETNINLNTQGLAQGNYIATISTENGTEAAVKFSVK